MGVGLTDERRADRRAHPRRAAVGVGIVLAVLFVALSAAPVSAQAVCDPYSGCSTTTTTPGVRPVIVIDLHIAVPGQVIKVRACGYVPGIVITFTFNGIVVAQSVLAVLDPPRTCDPNNFAFSRAKSSGGIFAIVKPFSWLSGPVRGLVAQAAPQSAYAEASFTVPAVPVGNYLVCAEAPGATTACTNLSVVAKTAGSVNGNPLARTGFRVTMFVLIGLAAIAVGRVLVRKSGRRARRN